MEIKDLFLLAALLVLNQKLFALDDYDTEITFERRPSSDFEYHDIYKFPTTDTNARKKLGKSNSGNSIASTVTIDISSATDEPSPFEKKPSQNKRSFLSSFSCLFCCSNIKKKSLLGEQKKSLLDEQME